MSLKERNQQALLSLQSANKEAMAEVNEAHLQLGKLLSSVSAVELHNEMIRNATPPTPTLATPTIGSKPTAIDRSTDRLVTPPIGSITDKGLTPTVGKGTDGKTAAPVTVGTSPEISNPVVSTTQLQGGSFLTPGFSFPNNSVYNRVVKKDDPKKTPPKLSFRSNMTPSEQARVERNPAIAAMGLDVVPRTTDQLFEDYNHIDFGNVRSPDSVRPKAIVSKPFTGKPPWRKWITRFQNICLANGYTNRQTLISLKEGLAEGPGKLALERFEEYGDGTLNSLLEHATHMLAKVGESDPRIELVKRMQLPDEDIRVFGFSIQQLVSEVYLGCRPDTPVVIQEATTRFVNGVRDPGCQAYLQEKWSPDISMSELFNLADVYKAKVALFPKLGIASVAQPQVGTTDTEMECSAYVAHPKKGNKSKKTSAPGKQVTTAAAGQDFSVMIKDEVARQVQKAGKWKGKKGKNSVLCNRCKKSGHYAQDCRAPAPISSDKPADKPVEKSGN